MTQQADRRTISIAALTREAADVLRSAGFAADESARDAGVLARARLGWDVTRWLADRHRPAPPGFEQALAAWTARRAAHEPVAYIIGQREFYGRLFRVTPDVLIPRPETELVVDEARALVAARELPYTVEILDIGTGSGCLAVTLALECPGSRVVATEISAAAVVIAEANARAHGVLERVHVERTSLAGGRVQACDLVVSNPPYVAEADRASLPTDVRDYEPACALFGGLDGLSVIRDLVPAAARALRPGGALVVELGFGQAADVERIVAAAGLVWRTTRPDLSGTPRVMVAVRPPAPLL